MLLRWIFLGVGVNAAAERALSITVSTVVVAGLVFYLIHRQQKLLLETRQLISQSADTEGRYRLLADNAVDVVAHVRGSDVVWISPSVQAALGWPPEHWIGTDFSHRIHPDDRDDVLRKLQTVTRDTSVVVRCRVHNADGGYHWVDAHGRPYVDSEGNIDGVITATRIVDEQVEAERQLKADRERFEAIVRNAPSAVSVHDLQFRYTLVNDAFCQLFGMGSPSGVIGHTLTGVLPPDALERSRLAATRMLAGESVFEEESISRGPDSIPVVTQRFPLRNSAGAITELVTIRDDVTHRRKAEQEAAEHALWDERIRTAIADGRLLVYSQPIVDIATRETVEEELLVRLRDTDTEQILTPDEFLPQCERHGLMPAIDRYMVARAIELARSGRHVCVNITGQTIGDTTAIGEILEVLAIAGPETTGKVLFEITETTALASPAVAEAFSIGMKTVGCRMALDDFGTGYGTFTELRSLDLDSLKIDQCFVQNMLADRDDERIVKTIAYVARQYGLTTVAEGVESEATLNRLAELGVDRAQGYVFSRPKEIIW